MNIQKVSCNSCGNLLQIETTTKYVTCNNCDTALELIQTGSSCYTKERSGNKTTVPTTNKISSNAVIYTELEMLDRAWQNDLPSYMYKGTLPDVEYKRNLAGGISAIVFSSVWIVFMICILPALGLLIAIPFGFFMMGMGIWQINEGSTRRQKYLNAKKKYEKQRKALEAQLKK